MVIERRLKLAAARGADFGTDTWVKVAFATGDMKRVDQHFGTAECIAVYALDSQRIALIEVAQFAPHLLATSGKVGGGVRPLADARGRSEDRLGEKIDAVDGCVAVYCRAVGASAVNWLRGRGIQAIRTPAGAGIRDLLEALQEDLRAGPPPWLAWAMVQEGPWGSSRFDDMEQEGWVE